METAMAMARSPQPMHIIIDTYVSSHLGRMETGSTSQEQDGARPRASPPALPCLVQLQVSAVSVGVDAINRRDGTVNRCLYSVADRLLRVRADPRPDPSGVRSADFAVDASRGLWARVFSFSSSQAPLPLVVYFHGGGFALFSARQCYFDRLCRRLCAVVGAVVVSVEYRLAPEHPYPAAYDDALDTLRFIDANGVPGLGEGVRVDLSSCFLAGESAGGNIIHHAANRWAAAAAPSSTPNSVRLAVAGIISVQPYFGGEERTESELRLDGVAPIVSLRRTDFWWKAFLPEGASRDHPAAHVTDENAGLAEAFPPAIVMVGGFDPLQDWQRRYADVLRRKGKAVEVVEFPEGIHAFYLFPSLPYTAGAMECMRAFVERNRTSSSSA